MSKRRPEYDPRALLQKAKLHADEAAFLLDVTPRTVKRYMEQEKLKYVRTPGGHRRVLTESVKKWM